MTTWILTTSAAAEGLLAVAATLPGPTGVLVVGGDDLAARFATCGADRVTHLALPEGTPAEAAAVHVAAFLASASPRVVLAAPRPADRIVLASAATAVGAAIVTGVTAVSGDDSTTTVVHGMFGGVSESTSTYAGPVALVLDGGATVTEHGAAVTVERIPVEAGAMTVVAREEEQVTAVDLGGARRVVAVGRGLRTREDLALVEELARATGAELACSRPLAEGQDWFAKDRYIGVSGQHIAPDLYIAIGISGQLQHMSGVRGARTIVAINSDEKAPIFAEADFGLVGDLYTLVPALSAALAEASR